MELDTMISLLTMVVTILMGFLAKKFKFIDTNLIPIQNIFIGLSIAIANYIVTKDFSIAIASSGIMAGGVYDIVHNLNKIIWEEE